MADATEFVKMSDKGQLVVPQQIREGYGLKPGNRFIAFPVKDGVLFKKIDMPDVKADFLALADEISSQFRQQKIRKNDVAKAVKWARQR